MYGLRIAIGCLEGMLCSFFEREGEEKRGEEGENLG